jgi:hypothetical protein
VTHSQVRYTQTGGFAGLKMVAQVDVSTLEGAQASNFERLVDEALAEEPPEPADSRVRDGQQYEVTITRDGINRVLRATDPVSRPALQALITDLSQRATPAR